MPRKDNKGGIEMMGSPRIDYQEQPSVFDKLMEPVQSCIEKQNQELTPHYLEKFSYYEFFRLLIFYYVSDIPSIALLLDTYLKKGLLSPALKLPKVARSTFNDAFERFPPDLFQAAFIYLLKTLSLKAIPELAALGTLYCIDGSLFPILSSLMWAEYKENFQAAKMHLCFELNRMIPVNIIIGTGNSNERDALRQMLVAKVTYIADRGYVCFQLFHDILTAQAHFVFRVKSNLVYTVQESLPVQLPKTVQALFQNVTDQIVRCNNDPFGHTYCLVRFQVGTVQFYLLTDRTDLTTFQIIMLYAYRWQVELTFRFLKRTMHGIHLINNSEQGVSIQFYVILIVALLQLKLKQYTLLQHEQENQDTDTGDDADANQEPDADATAENSTTQAETASGKPISHPYQFFDMIGEKLKKYWKIGIHWLTALRTILDHPFDNAAIEILASG
jgi:Transposase DDE domain